MLPTEPFSYDLNGFANPPDGRFSEDNPCREPQEHPVSYPFTSYDGAVTFTAPRVGLRDIDYNVEGLVHIGMFAEMVEDLRGDGVSEASIDALFQSAEAYLQLWERAEARGAALAAGE